MNSFLKKIIILLFVLLLFLSTCLSFYIYSFNLFFPKQYRPLIYQKAQEYALSPLLISAIIYTESRFNKTAKSNRGALGLMQLMPETAKEIAHKFKIKNFQTDLLLQSEINLQFGCFYLSKLMKILNNDTKSALIAYNAGKTNLFRWQKECTENNDTLNNITNYCFAETKNYVENIEKIYNFLNLADKIIKKTHQAQLFNK